MALTVETRGLTESALGGRHRLRPYQAEAGRGILESVLGRKGLTFTVEIARQGGKNELSAQLETLLLTLFMFRGGDGVKASPTFKPQTLISLARLKECLNDAGYRGFWRSEQGYIVKLGRTRQIFLSADGSSHVVGTTASLLLEVDEAQDVEAEKYYKEFRPMGSAHNVTTVLYGTAWDETTLLEEMVQLNLELERRDGLRRHFQYDWQEVAKYNPDYLKFVEGERERLGESHPLFLTQYCLVPLRGGSGFLSPRQRAQLAGLHSRYYAPLTSGLGVGGQAKPVYMAGIDLGGVAEGEMLEQDRDRDATVVTIGELDYSTCDEVIKTPLVRVVEHYRWVGLAHRELYPRLVDLLKNVWGCRRVVVDSTGLGQGLASFLAGALGERVVRPFTFTASSKSDLGYSLLAAINRGGLKMYAADGSEEYQEFWHQVERARSLYRPNRTMNFFVDPAQGHDDYLMSLALLVAAVESYMPREAHGRLRED